MSLLTAGRAHELDCRPAADKKGANALVKDTLILKGMGFYAYHGDCKEETVLGQKFVVDMELEYDMAELIAKDWLSGFGYVEAYQAAERVVTKERYNLIQKLAERITEEVFKAKPDCKATVTVTKPAATVGGYMESVGARVVREGPAYRA